jgi:type VII secretion protein essA
MKKTIVFIFLLFSFFTSWSVAFANDGSLQIDTSLDKNPKKTEIQYFEQESNLAKLFQPDTYKAIDAAKKNDREKYQSFQTTLFITKVEVGNIVDEYQSALFSGQIQMIHSDKKNVSLNNVKAPISWTTILLFILGMIITIYSLLYKKLHKPKQ